MNAEPLVGADLAQSVLADALGSGGDFAELYCEERSGFALSVDESRVERPQRGAERGAGVRVVSGDTAYFAHVDGLAEADLRRAASAAAAALSGERSEVAALAAVAAADLQDVQVDPEEVAAERKADLLRSCDERARAAGGEIAQVQVSYGENRRRVTVANSEGTFAADDRTRVRFAAQVVARRAERVETGFETLGGHRGFELVEGGAAERTAERAAQIALTLLDADPA
ncbi:MAG: TldD protein, partial [Solirubrobacterales bacterium]|nr:TldD protein [Solirubrobacterales bacterium]